MADSDTNLFGISAAEWEAMSPELRRVWMEQIGYARVRTVPAKYAASVNQRFIIQAPDQPNMYLTVNIGTEAAPRYVHAPKTLGVEDLTQAMKIGPMSLIADTEKTDQGIKKVSYWTRLAAYYGLRQMDVVWHKKDGAVTGFGGIVAINGCRISSMASVARFRFRPYTLDCNLTAEKVSAMTPDGDKNVELPRMDFPVLVGDTARAQWPWACVVDKTGKSLGPALRMIGFLVPTGAGTVGFIMSEGGGGKTFIAEDYLAAGANFTVARNLLPSLVQSDEEVHVIYVSLGERQGDITAALQKLELVDYDPTHVEVYFCGATGRASWLNNLAQFAFARAQRLAETGKKHVIVIFDSLSRWERAASSSTDASKYLTGGIPPEVLDMIRSYSSAGAYWQGWGSLTLIATMLAGPDPTVRVQNAEGALAFQVADSGSTSIVWLVKKGKIYPRLNVSQDVSKTRRVTSMCTPNQLAEMETVEGIMWTGCNSEGRPAKEGYAGKALERLRDESLKHPIPADMPGWDGVPWWEMFRQSTK
jgi:hypothetical protein